MSDTIATSFSYRVQGAQRSRPQSLKKSTPVIAALVPKQLIDKNQLASIGS